MPSRAVTVLFATAAPIVSAATTDLKWQLGGLSGTASEYDPMEVAVGDSIRFHWTGEHNLEQLPTKANYEDCYWQDATVLEGYSDPGEHTVTFDQEGTFYYMCGYTGHCAAGQKIKVCVGAGGCAEDDEGGDDPCFPSSASVTLADGTVARIDSLKEGDSIVSATDSGALSTDTVSLLSVAKPESSDTFLTLSTAANATLTLTPEHHIPVGAECCATLKQAKDVSVGETVWAVKDGKASATTVTATSKAHAKGLHSPVLTHGGFPVVDGLVTSFDSIDKVRLATYGLAPLLVACKASGTCDKFKEMFLADDRKYVEALQRRRLFGGATFTGGINLQDGFRGRRL